MCNLVRDIRSSTNFKQTVLIVDDQSIALNIHRAILESLKLNLNIVTKTDPFEALEWSKNKQIDLIITDFSMGGMNGLDLIQLINSVHKDKLIPVVIITVLKSKHLHKRLIKAGVSACITKPVSTNSLSNITRFLLQRSKDFYNNQLASH